MARTVLIVEDDRALAGTLEIALAALEGVEPVLAHDGREAISFLENSTNPPAIVLTDLDLPRVDGYQLIRWIRERPDRFPMPVLAMSARADAGGAAEAGADEFFGKPFSLAAVRVRIQELMNG